MVSGHGLMSVTLFQLQSRDICSPAGASSVRMRAMARATGKALVLATPTRGDIEADGAEIRELILQTIRDRELLRSICKDQAMPARSTVHCGWQHRRLFGPIRARVRDTGGRVCGPDSGNRRRCLSGLGHEEKPGRLDLSGF